VRRQLLSTCSTNVSHVCIRGMLEAWLASQKESPNTKSVEPAIEKLPAALIPQKLF